MVHDQSDERIVFRRARAAGADLSEGRPRETPVRETIIRKSRDRFLKILGGLGITLAVFEGEAEIGPTESIRIFRRHHGFFERCERRL